MTTNRQLYNGNNKPLQVLSGVAQWPPLVYVILGVVLAGIWALGTSVQVLTSEAWMMHEDLKDVNYNAFGQLWDAAHGQLPSAMFVPFIFGWGVQFALIVASVGIEMPKHPAWRYYLSWATVIGLVVVNSCGDFASSGQYGFWGQCGFTLVIFFVTFCMGLFAIMAFMHAWRLITANHGSN